MVIVAATYGRMSNRLWIFAHLAASAREHGYEVWNPSFFEFAHLFPATARDGLCRFPPRSPRLAHPRLRRPAFLALRKLADASLRLGGRPVPVIRLGDGEALDLATPDFVSRARSGPLLVQGWLFRDVASLVKHGDEVRRFLRPQAHHLEAADEAAERARGSADLLVGVHARRADYRKWHDGRFYWETDVYSRLMRETASLFPGRTVSFLVCSDEHPPGLEGTPGTGDAVGDLYALARCDYLLGPPSTYSEWASFYGRVPLNIVLRPDQEVVLDDFRVRTDRKSWESAPA